MSEFKIDTLDAHDRLLHFTKQSFDIGECCQDLINKRPFGDRSFYIFAHARTDDDGVTKRLIWQPRLTKPEAQTNSMLFKAYLPDKIKIIWMIPDENLWPCFERGQMTENELINRSIQDYMKNRKKMEAPEKDDLDDHEIDAIYRNMKKKLNFCDTL